MKKEWQFSYEDFDSWKELSEEDQLLVQKAFSICEDAFAPYSEFKVGASLKMSDGQIILGIFFALAVLKYRPYLQNFWKMAVITILLLIPVLVINLIIGGEANYWYLMDTPDGESLMDLMPAPPFHMLGVAPLALVVFFITYIPFLIWDKTKKA